MTAPPQQEDAIDARVLATGLAFPEGPAIARDGALLVVELANRRIARFARAAPVAWIWLPGAPNGLAFGIDGALYVCDNGGYWPPCPSTGGLPGPGDQPGRIWRIYGHRTPEVYLDSIEGRPLNGPNDLGFDDRGGLYFTDPVWLFGDDGLRLGDVCYVAPDGTAARVHHGIRFPNGLHVTPDGAALIVGETDTGLLHSFPILAPGQLGEPSVYAECGPDTSPDGMCFDADGRLIVTLSTGGRTLVLAPGGGRIEREIRSEDPCPTNACFGGPDGRTLFITEGGQGRVVALDWPVPGLRLFPDRLAPWPASGVDER